MLRPNVAVSHRKSARSLTMPRPKELLFRIRQTGGPEVNRKFDLPSCKPITRRSGAQGTSLEHRRDLASGRVAVES